jgi:hypothetical protein
MVLNIIKNFSKFFLAAFGTKYYHRKKINKKNTDRCTWYYRNTRGLPEKAFPWAKKKTINFRKYIYIYFVNDNYFDYNDETVEAAAVVKIVFVVVFVICQRNLHLSMIAADY